MIQVIHFMSNVFSNEVVSCMLIYVKIHPCRTPEVLSGSSSSREAKGTVRFFPGSKAAPPTV